MKLVGPIPDQFEPKLPGRDPDAIRSASLTCNIGKYPSTIARLLHPMLRPMLRQDEHVIAYHEAGMAKSLI